MTNQQNLDAKVVRGFGDEWQRFDQSGAGDGELAKIVAQYFHGLPIETLPRDAIGADIGCGSGRWARFVAPQVHTLHCVDASDGALSVARRNLVGAANVQFHHASVDALPFADGSLDFAYSLGVLHHVPDTRAAIAACVRKLKPGAPFLVYLYYRFDNRPAWFPWLWRTSELARFVVSRSPAPVRNAAAEVLATTVYWPMARAARLLERAGRDVQHMPLSWYRDQSFYVMRNDALDRFGTRLEQRFTREEVVSMLEAAGVERVQTWGPPYWCAVGHKAR